MFLAYHIINGVCSSPFVPIVEVSARFSRSSSQEEAGSEAKRQQEVQQQQHLSHEDEETRNAQHEMLLAYQRAVAERDAALQNFQLRIIELERQLASAQQNGAAPPEAGQQGESYLVTE